MTLYADDPDVHVVFPVTDRNGQPIDVTPAVVKVEGYNDVVATWLGDPSVTRDLKVPLYGLPPQVALKLRLVIPDENDIALTANSGGVVMRQSDGPGGSYDTGSGVDHGDVSGALSLAGGTHEMDLAGDVVLTILGGSDVTLVLHGTGQSVTVAGETFEVDGDEVIFVLTTPRGVRIAYLAGSGEGGGGDGETPDSTPPSAVTTLVATGGEGEIDLSWSASTDAESTVSYRYRAYLTSGGPSGAYTTTTGTSATISGLAAGAYTAEVYAYSSGGASASDTATATVAAPLVPITDTFTAADGTDLIGRTPTGSPTPWESSEMGNHPGAVTPKIVANKVNVNGLSGFQYAAQFAIASANAVAAIDYDFAGSTGFSVTLAIGTPGSYVFADLRDNEVLLWGAVGSQIGANVPIASTSGRLEVSVSGLNVTLKIDGSTIISGTRSNTTWINPKVAVGYYRGNTNGPTLDNLSVTLS